MFLRQPARVFGELEYRTHTAVYVSVCADVDGCSACSFPPESDQIAESHSQGGTLRGRILVEVRNLYVKSSKVWLGNTHGSLIFKHAFT